jgi:hypothetical protein
MAFGTLSTPGNILWSVDNTTTLAYVKKEGGTCSLQVLVEAEKVLVKGHQMSVCILLVFIPTGKKSWQTQRLDSKRFQTGSFTPSCTGRSRQDGCFP